MRVLVAVDRSEASQRALEYALELAPGLGAEVTVVHAVDPAVYELGGREPVADISDADRRLLLENVADTERRGEVVLEEATAAADEAGGDVATELLYGDPLETIPTYAQAGAFDAIYVGHRDHSGRARELLGSVSRGMIERASVPVTVVR